MGDEGKREANVQQALQANPEPVPDLDQIYRDHHRRVIQAAYRVTGNAQDAEDVLQTVFMRLVRREGGSPLSDSLGNYLHRAAVNAGYNALRSQERRQNWYDKLAQLWPMETSPSDPAEIAEHNLQLEKVRHNISRLSPAQREVIWLRFGAGLSTTEVGNALGKSTGTVKALQYNGIASLRKLMEQSA